MNTKNCRVVITAGGVSEKIDNVRKITNSSSGKLGFKIAKILKDQYRYDVTLITTKQAMERFGHNVEGAEIVIIESTEQLEQAVKSVLIEERVDIFIHSMAVADYTTDAIINMDLLKENILNGTSFATALSLSTMDNSGKVSSDANIMIKLRKTPKVIKMIKELSPRTFLVGFKLLDNVSDKELFDVGFELLRKNRCNLVVANDISKIREGNHEGLIIYPEKSYDKIVGKNEIAAGLCKIINKRAFVLHPQSIQVDTDNNVKLDNGNNKYAVAYADMRQVGKLLYDAGWLPEVTNHEDGRTTGTYGNMSILLDDCRIMMTSRNVHKGDLGPDDVSYIHSVEETSDEEGAFAKVRYSSQRKPSIDTAIHAKIYETFGYGCRSIVHVHTNKVFLGYPYIDEQFPCGSMEERDAIIKALQMCDDDVKVAQMKNHGLVVVGSNIYQCYYKIRELFGGTPYINKDAICKDEEVLDHIAEVGAEWVYKFGTLYNLELNGETIGCVWEDIKDSIAKFGLFTKKNCRKGLNIVGNYLKVYFDKRYCLHTSPGCNIVDFYKTKHGFMEFGQSENGNLILLMK